MASHMIQQPSAQTRRLIELVNELAAGRIDVQEYYRLSAKLECEPPQARQPAPPNIEAQPRRSIFLSERALILTLAALALIGMITSIAIN